MIDAPVSSKDRLRADMRTARRTFVQGLAPAERRRLETAAADRALPLLRGANVVAGYVAMGHEIDPAPLLTSAGAAARIVLPWFADRDAPMRFREGTGPLEDGPFGPQPQGDADEAAPDALIVPLVAIDPAGRRIGQGKGHFDRALAALGAARPIRTIGLAWDVQIVEAVPADPWDVGLSAIVTPTRALLA